VLENDDSPWVRRGAAEALTPFKIQAPALTRAIHNNQYPYDNFFYLFIYFFIKHKQQPNKHKKNRIKMNKQANKRKQTQKSNKQSNIRNK
jgi:hypothetical protein